ncbi:MAG: YdbL family protein [Deltaproteobacteria bacterium]|nr:YdbL family protein [Deltaproteobacteria bacterium]
MPVWRRKLTLTLAALLLLTAACITVNIYFPAAKVQQAAEKIVDDVYQNPGQKDGTPTPGSSGLLRYLAWLGPRQALAADATTVSNPTIRALKDQLAARHRELLPFYQGGQVGINRDGYLEVRGTGGLNLGQVAQLKRLVAADNQARRSLYQEVAAALGLKPQQVPQVQKIFADTWRARAQGGWWVQDDAGTWRKK